MRYGFGATSCPSGQVDKNALMLELVQGLKSYEGCLKAMGLDSRTPTARGRVVQAALDCISRSIGSYESTCIAAQAADTVRELIAVIKILCTYPETEQTLRQCQDIVKTNEQRVRDLQGQVDSLNTLVDTLEKRPESCAPCAAPPPPPPSVKYGTAIGLVVAAGGITYVATKLLRKKKG